MIISVLHNKMKVIEEYNYTSPLVGLVLQGCPQKTSIVGSWPHILTYIPRVVKKSLCGQDKKQEEKTRRRQEGGKKKKKTVAGHELV